MWLSIPTNKVTSLTNLTDLNKQIAKCKKCSLWKNAKNVVPGKGPSDAKIMLVGQNPGADEDQAGVPFIGRAGKFLDKVLAANGIDRGKLFVTNIVKHVTPNNRKPSPEEIAACVPHLLAQIEIINPQLVVLMGAVAWQTPRIAGIQYVETVHPSAAMRFTKMRARFMADFEAIWDLIQKNFKP